MTSDAISHSELVSLAHQLGDRSAEIILPFFRQDLAVDVKGGQDAAFDPVTEGDRAAESGIRTLIEATYPSHAILGEEHGTKQVASPYRWVIDPIDGTRAFILGLPTWGTLIGVEINERPTIGLMNQPFTGDRFWTDGNASFFRDREGRVRELKTRESVTLRDAQMATTNSALFEAGSESAVYAAFSTSVRACRLGTDCWGYALLAAGLIDIVVETGLKPYDIVALIPIIENAGGVVTSWDGGTARHGGQVLAAANPALHAEALNLIAKVASESPAA
ncbi:MAG: histidinol-phosphatase [Hyphomicrobiaceae bacterium]